MSLGELERLWQLALGDLGVHAEGSFFIEREGRIEISQERVAHVLGGRGGLFSRFLRQSHLQWRVERYLAGVRGQAPVDANEARRRSFALGLCQRALELRLPRRSAADFARWLAAPDSAPRGARATVRKLLELQRERDGLSAEWRELGPDPFLEEAAAASSGEGASWLALPVSPGTVEGVWWLAPTVGGTPPEDAAILVFRKARPETVALFPRARALIFAEGGVLSHACSVAREQGIPCVTAVGAAFVAALEKAPADARLRVESRTDGESRVTILSGR